MKYIPLKAPYEIRSIGHSLELALKCKVPSVPRKFKYVAIDKDGLIWLYLYKPTPLLAGWTFQERYKVGELEKCRQVDPIIFNYDVIRFIKENWKQCIFELGDKQR